VALVVRVVPVEAGHRMALLQNQQEERADLQVEEHLLLNCHLHPMILVQIGQVPINHHHVTEIRVVITVVEEAEGIAVVEEVVVIVAAEEAAVAAEGEDNELIFSFF
jgi:hypothetical protein